ncbi:MAG: right-handed parallel beta-helix repeat-containing protein, partial [Muribaculum sp.]|nr:right-handed parallel beta-helix repeat-containing protein [Muribaculum sp.]
CERVLFEGVTFENSPRWNVRPLLCRDVTLRNVSIRNPAYAQNGDGLDIESCSNVHVTGCTFDVGDDAICLKSGKDEAGRRRGVPTSNVLIEDCKVYSGHGGFVVGSEMSGGVYDVAVRNCLFIGTDTGIKFKSTRGRGGAVRDIHISGIKMVDIAGDAITADMYYAQKSPGQHAEPVGESTPVIDGISLSGISCTGAARALWLNGLPEMPIRNVVLSNSIISSESGAIINNADSVTLNNVTINHSTGSRVTATNTVNLTEL